MLVASVFWFSVVTWLDVVYLLDIGIKTWRSAAMAMNEFDAETDSVAKKGHYKRMRQEFLIAISNPKAIFIFTAMFPQLLDLKLPVAP